MEIRICTKCGIAKDLEKFYRYSAAGEGRCRQCKPCVAARHRARYHTPGGKAIKDAATKRWMTQNRDRWNEMQARNWRRRAAAKRSANLELPPPA